MSDQGFTGCKLAYVMDDRLLVYLRDNRADIPHPGLWDFPGGGREGNESPEQCVLRELYEEFAIALPPERLMYKKRVPNFSGDGHAFFFVAFGQQAEIDAVVFGDEGQYWQLMPIADYLSHPLAIATLQSRLSACLELFN